MSRSPKKYNINDIKAKFQTVAIDNRYQAFIEPNGTIYDAASYVGVNRRFVDEDLGLYVSDAVLPGSSFADIEISGDRQGITERVPFKRIYDDVTFTFMVDREYRVLRFFEAWNQLINPLHSDRYTSKDNRVMTLNYPKDYKCTLGITKFNKDYGVSKDARKNVKLRYTFYKAWPLSVASTPVNYAGGNMLQLNVTFRYDRYIMSDVTSVIKRAGYRGISDSFDPWMGGFGTRPLATSSQSKTEDRKTEESSTNQIQQEIQQEIKQQTEKSIIPGADKFDFTTL
tara:strand:+ start:47 stop:898 length:852 start_codon:yes stop_codon:yes gene_type:complete